MSYFAWPNTAASASTALAFTVTGSSAATNGMYLPAANTVGFSANSTAVMALRSSNTGQVALGNRQEFGVVSTRNSKLSIWSTGNDRYFGAINENASTGARLYLGVSSGVVGTPGYPASSAVLGAIDFYGGNTDTAAYVLGPTIESVAGSTWTSTNRQSNLRFYTIASAATSQTLALTIGSDQSLTVVGNFACNGQTPAARATYTVTNLTTDRTYDADTVAVAELADIVGTLIADLRAIGLVA